MPRITKKAVDALKANSSPLWDDQLKGFGVRVSGTGKSLRKNYVVVYRPFPGGRTAPKRWYGIGPHGSPWTADTARTEAKRILGLVADGDDPARDKATERQKDGKTVSELVDSFVTLHAKRKAPRSWQSTERLLKQRFVPVIGTKRPCDVSRADIAGILDDMAGETPIAANRALICAKMFFRWCVERGHAESNPCESLSRPAAPSQGRERVLSDDELLEVWKAAEAVGTPWAALVKLLVLTGQRRTEVAAMKWAEVDSDKKLWTLPADRTKNKTAHEVPLTETALAVIEAQPRIKSGKTFCPYILTTSGTSPVSGFSKAKKAIDAGILKARRKEVEKAKEMPSWTLHDLRRTTTTGMARLGISPHVADKVLNHKSGSIKGVAAIYNRFTYADDMRRALEAWERHVLAVVTGTAKADNVVKLAG
ncbi:MAG: tyrosine-type recombinase/integrase [Alphaproteobacteria bacterium]|nr:tyrosine-type recombinase/integrase [Alphaproteobacteria bacterium]